MKMQFMEAINITDMKHKILSKLEIPQMSKMGKRVFWNILISDFKLFWSVLILFFTFGCAYSGFDDDSIKYKKEGLLKEEVSTAVELMLDSI
jgi:hypothetical protein